MSKQNPASEWDRSYLKRIGERIRTVREKLGYSSYEVFAFEKNISRSQVWKYEKGLGNPTLITLLKIIKALDMTPGEFFSEGFDSW